MKQRVEILKALADKLLSEIELVSQDLLKENISRTSKETIIEETALMNGFLRNIKDSIDKVELCCSEKNLNLSDMETQYFKRALEKHKGHIEKSAKWLGVSTRTMSRRIVKLKINVSDYKGNSTPLLTKDDKMSYASQ